MVDSICPRAMQGQADNIVSHKPIFPDRCKPEMRILVSAMLKASSRMVDQWKMPSWGSRDPPVLSTGRRISFAGQVDELESPLLRFQRNGSNEPLLDHSRYEAKNSHSRRFSDPSQIPSFFVSGGLNPSNSASAITITTDTNKITAHSSSTSHPPPTVLLRCQDYVPVPKSANPYAVSRVDVAREDPFLGWEQYHPELIQAVIPISGHHFNLFSERNVISTGMQMKVACHLLDSS